MIQIHYDHEIAANLPIGEVIIGNVDPTSLTPEQFSHSVEILYHGSKDKFIFTRNFNYKENPTPNSHTAGAGFYSTPDRHDAELFSEAFGAREELYVTEIMPYQAKILDLRRQGDPIHNAAFPTELQKKYLAFVESQYAERYVDYDPKIDIEIINNTPVNLEGETDKKEEGELDWDSFFNQPAKHANPERTLVVDRFLQWQDLTDYLRSLKNLSSKQSVDLREMLSIRGDATISEYGSHFFSDFMITQGFDGVVYVEGGDHAEHQKTHPASFVFFNLEKIGDYEAWHQ